jgi:hypothetical protein
MSKKKRKTRKEKETIVHKFSHAKTEVVAKVAENINEETGEKKPTVSKSNVAPYVMKDLKKVLIVTGSIIAFVMVVWILVYQTNLLNGIFDKLNIKY